ncbi:MAG: glycoside hydrolase family 172 protein [Fimbriimonadaceae bacterium]
MIPELFQHQPGIETRWFSPENWKGEKGAGAQAGKGRKGSAFFALESGESKVLGELTGDAGTLRRMWMTISRREPMFLRGLKIEFYWDGSDKPAISAPVGDFFGQPLGQMATFDSAVFSNPEGKSLNLNLPMPFRKGFKCVLVNEAPEKLEGIFFDLNATIGDPHDENTLYLHAFWNRQNPTKAGRDYEFLPKVTGRGRFLGVNFGVAADQERYLKTWWGEGEVKYYVDGDTDFPTLVGTGTEDFIGTGWGQGPYHHLYQGCHMADYQAMRYGFYRYHVPDPVLFHHDFRATIQQIGGFGGEEAERFIGRGAEFEHAGQHVNLAKMRDEQFFSMMEREDDWSSCAYVYLERPENELSPLAGYRERVAEL